MNKNILFTCYPTLNTEGFESVSATKKTIPGAIVIYSCNKHKETRLKKFVLSKKNYNGWKVFIIIGNPFLKTDYEIEDNIITIKCEDSYIHLSKKIILGFKIIFELYNVEEGILRCGDDLVFNETKLEKFTKIPNKSDYLGSIIRYDKVIVKHYDNFMPDYFNSHPQDLTNPLNGIPYTLEEMQKFNQVPLTNYASGVLIYFSKKACDILIDHMEIIDWNVFHKSEKYGYPYIIEDITIGFILNKNNIYPVSYKIYGDSLAELENMNDTSIAMHTNEYKENYRNVQWNS